MEKTLLDGSDLISSESARRFGIFALFNIYHRLASFSHSPLLKRLTSDVDFDVCKNDFAL
jgi:hypothetical protein